MNMLSSLSVVARGSSARHSTRVELGACSIEVAARSGVDMCDWDDGHRGTSWFTYTAAGSGVDNQGSDPALPSRSQDSLRRPCRHCRCPRHWLLCDLPKPDDRYRSKHHL